MATLATVALKLAKQLGRTNSGGTAITDLEAEIKEEIADTIKFYNRAPWSLTEVRGMVIETVATQAWYSTVDLSGAAGDQSVTGRTSVDFNTVISLHYVRQEDEPMNRISYERFETLSEGTPSSGDPSNYAMYAGQIGLWPTPDAAYTIYLSGIVKPVVPSADADTSVWFDEAEELIVAGAGKRICLKYLRDSERAQEFAATEAMAEAQLEREHMRKSSTGRVRVNE